MRKGQSQMVSAIIIVLIGLGIVGTVLPWASSVIQKKKDSKSVDDVYNFYKDLDSSIVDIARNGGEESLEIKVPGRITVYPDSYPGDLNNSIVFIFESKVSNVAESQEWIPLNTANANYTAVLGIDKPGVIFAKSSIGDDKITVWYRLWFRELRDQLSGKTYKISISGTNDRSSNQGFLRVQRVGSSEIGNLIRTEVNIIV
jgi:hypothetical protein